MANGIDLTDFTSYDGGLMNWVINNYVYEA